MRCAPAPLRRDRCMRSRAAAARPERDIPTTAGERAPGPAPHRGAARSNSAIAARLGRHGDASRRCRAPRWHRAAARRSSAGARWRPRSAPAAARATPATIGGAIRTGIADAATPDPCDPRTRPVRRGARSGRVARARAAAGGLDAAAVVRGAGVTCAPACSPLTAGTRACVRDARRAACPADRGGQSPPRASPTTGTIHAGSGESDGHSPRAAGNARAGCPKARSRPGGANAIDDAKIASLTQTWHSVAGAPRPRCRERAASDRLDTTGRRRANTPRRSVKQGTHPPPAATVGTCRAVPTAPEGTTRSAAPAGTGGERAARGKTR
jgi:hypothetical protein